MAEAAKLAPGDPGTEPPPRTTTASTLCSQVGIIHSSRSGHTKGELLEFQLPPGLNQLLILDRVCVGVCVYVCTAVRCVIVLIWV
jgi:hypothetical protein